MNIIINGYGVPKDIFRDQNYHAYLGQILNYLWVNYSQQKLNIILCGGNSDMYKPYKRTEAGEMYKWLHPRFKKLGLNKNWQLIKNNSGLSAVENLLSSQELINSGAIIYFCEMTRKVKSQKLVSQIFGKESQVMAIEFDTSPARYNTKIRAKLEKEDLKYSLRALKDGNFRKIFQQANQEKIKHLRVLSDQQRKEQIDKITIEVRRKYLS